VTSLRTDLVLDVPEVAKDRSISPDSLEGLIHHLRRVVQGGFKGDRYDTCTRRILRSRLYSVGALTNAGVSGSSHQWFGPTLYRRHLCHCGILGCCFRGLLCGF